LFGCDSDSNGPPASPTPVQELNIDALATSASAADVQGIRRQGLAPPSTNGPRVTATGNQRIVNGGTLAVAIASDAPISGVYIFVGGRTLGLVGEATGGIEGYYEVRLPSPQTSVSVLLTFPQEIPLTEFDLQFAGVSSSGAVGPYVGLTTSVTSVGTGDVQVTLSWDVDSDTDLHVVGPGDDEIYYGRRQSPSGGELDLDSNAGCNIDGIRNENITWPVGRAPRGQYIVRVDYWSACGVGRTNYTVRINNGGNVQIVTGFFSGSGDTGGAGSGRTVASFERTSGPAAVTITQPMLLESARSVTKRLIATPSEK
jgi:uncharacterized protein YfaP (DUF2135 family)